MRKRQYGHPSDIQNGRAGLDKYFAECHGDGRDLKLDSNLDKCLEKISLVLLASIRLTATFSLVDAHLIATTLPGPGQRYKLCMCF